MWWDKEPKDGQQQRLEEEYVTVQEGIVGQVTVKLIGPPQVHVKGIVALQNTVPGSIFPVPVKLEVPQVPLIFRVRVPRHPVVVPKRYIFPEL